MPKIEEVTSDLVQEKVKRERKLTPMRRRFIQELLSSPESPTDAAIRSGYSPKSARFIASRLLQDPYVQSELAKHFLEQEKVVSDALASTLTRLQHMVEQGTDKVFLKAAKLLMEYTRLAVPILGLEIKRKPGVVQPTDPVSLEGLITEHEHELERLKQLHARQILSEGVEGPAN